MPSIDGSSNVLRLFNDFPNTNGSNLYYFIFLQQEENNKAKYGKNEFNNIVRTAIYERDGYCRDD